MYGDCAQGEEGAWASISWLMQTVFFQFVFCKQVNVFFLCKLVASSDRLKFFGIFKKKRRRRRSNDVVKPFLSWNNSFNLKNEHSNSVEKNRNKNRNIFYSILCILLIQICKCFNVILGYQGLILRDFCMVNFFFRIFFFNPTDRPNIKKRIRR